MSPPQPQTPSSRDRRTEADDGRSESPAPPATKAPLESQALQTPELPRELELRLSLKLPRQLSKEKLRRLRPALELRLSLKP